MAKAIGLIGNFKGKVGNMVGYQIPDSNTGNTQGIRIYQPVVKNPKTSAQAEQRAKLAPINATYRALKSIIDRGNEGLPYGNKSRLAWLKGAFNAVEMPWIEKGKVNGYPVGCQLTKGSLGGIQYANVGGTLKIQCDGATGSSTVTTIGAVSTLLLAAYPQLKSGDQITIVTLWSDTTGMRSEVNSFILDATSAVASDLFAVTTDILEIDYSGEEVSFAVIVSREGESGQHLRSTAALVLSSTMIAAAPYDATSKTAAIASYMASAAGSTDWAEESIQ